MSDSSVVLYDLHIQLDDGDWLTRNLNGLEWDRAVSLYRGLRDIIKVECRLVDHVTGEVISVPSKES